MGNLNSAIEDVYSAFAAVPKPDEIAACPCCIDEATLSRLVTTPLRAISADDLSPYASSAFLTAAEVEDYLYFLPRILEISITDDTWWPSLEVTGRAIREIKPGEWPEARRQAVQMLFESLFRNFLHEKYYFRIDEWICGAARAGFDVKSLLQIIEDDEEAIVEFFKANEEVLDAGKLGNSFWEDYDSGQEIIRKWFNSENVRKVLSKRTATDLK